MLHRALLAAAAGLVLASPALAQEQDFDQAVREVLGGDPAAYRRVIEGFQAAVRDGDADAAAALVSYPIGVSIGGKEVTIRTPRPSPRNSPPSSPRHRRGDRDRADLGDDGQHQGVMLGRGEVWVSGICADDACKRSEVKVITIQSGPE